MPHPDLARILSGQATSPGPGLPPVAPPQMPMPEAAGPGPVGAAPIRKRTFLPGNENPSQMMLAQLLMAAGYIDPKALDAYPSSGGPRELEFLNKHPMDESMSRSLVGLRKRQMNPGM